MQQQDFSQEKNLNWLAKEDIAKWQSILQMLSDELMITNIRAVDSSFLVSSIEDLNRIYKCAIPSSKSSEYVTIYFHSIKAFIENIDDTLTDLNLALDVLERGEHEESITNYADSRRIFYHSLYRCRRYIEEALRQFKL